MNTTKTCRYISSVWPKQITSITHTIPSTLTSSISITTYTYFAVLNSYQPLCSQLYTVQLLPQTQSLTAGATSANFNSTRCGSSKVNANNTNTVLLVNVSSAAVGDYIRVYGLLGILSTPWIYVSSNGSSSYWQTALLSSNILNSTTIQLAFVYTNPTYTTLLNKITNFSLIRSFNSSL